MILIIDFGSQYNQLIARKVREENVFCRIAPPDIRVTDDRPYSEYFFVRRAWNKLTGKHASLH